MTNNLDLAARILKVMSADDRGAILGAMNSEVAAKITKLWIRNLKKSRKDPIHDL